METKHAQISLPYFKQGCDLYHHLETSKTIEEALEGHAKQLEGAVAILRGVKEIIANKDVSLDADTHMISISGPADVIDALIEADLAELDDYDEEDDWEEDLDDEDDEDDES